MRVMLISFLSLFFVADNLFAQPKGYSKALSAGFVLPVGNFSQTHLPGIEAGILFANKPYIFLSEKPAKKIAFIYGSNIRYYFGRKETVSGYSYRYNGYGILTVLGGCIYKPGKKTNISLTAGPAFSRYNKSTRFNIASALSANYYITKNWGISPALTLINETGATPLWSVGIMASYAF